MTKKQKTQSPGAKIYICANPKETELDLEGDLIGWSALLIIAIEKCPEFKKSMQIAIGYINEQENK
jgi:hypothetical protein